MQRVRNRIKNPASVAVLESTDDDSSDTDADADEESVVQRRRQDLRRARQLEEQLLALDEESNDESEYARIDDGLIVPEGSVCLRCVAGRN
eukprot:m.241122 g.241122  ORF g.241122 m.241122 type:complete len:91 (-) comp10939_c1_seq14:2324-2596(-)